MFHSLNVSNNFLMITTIRKVFFFKFSPEIKRTDEEKLVQKWSMYLKKNLYCIVEKNINIIIQEIIADF